MIETRVTAGGQAVAVLWPGLRRGLRSSRV